MGYSGFDAMILPTVLGSVFAAFAMLPYDATYPIGMNAAVFRTLASGSRTYSLAKEKSVNSCPPR